MNLNQVTLPVLDIPRAIEFYEAFGLKLIVHSNDDYARFLCQNGATFSVHKVAKVAAGNVPTIYFECDDVDAEVTRLKKEGVSFITEATDQRWLWREAALEDIDGNKIIIYQAGENRINPPWRIL